MITMPRLYLLLTFVITYFFWGLTAILSGLNLYIHPSCNIGIVLYVIAVCAPAISAYIVFQKDADRKGLRYFLKWAFSLKHFFFGFLLVVVFCGIRFGVPLLLDDASLFGNWWQVLAFMPVMLLFGGFEEIGWRGYLQPELESKFGFFTATLINAGIWTIWHIPLCFIQGTYQYSGNLLWFTISLLGSAFSLAAIRKVSGSILACILFHCVVNAIMSYGISIRDGFGILITTGIQVFIAVTMVAWVDFRKQT